MARDKNDDGSNAQPLMSGADADNRNDPGDQRPRRRRDHDDPDCPHIATESASHGSSPPLAPEHSSCAIRRHRRWIEKCVARAIARAPIGILRGRVRLPAWGARLPGVRAVRERLYEDREDIAQEVADEFDQQVKRGNIPAAHPVIAPCFATIARRVVWRKTRKAVRSLLLAAKVDVNDERGADQAFENSTPEELFDRRLTQPRVKRDRAWFREGLVKHPDVLTAPAEGDREAVILWLEGLTDVMIAQKLGLTREATAQRLFRAKRAIAAVIEICENGCKR